MSDEVLQAHRIEPIVPVELVADPDLDALYKMALAAARKHNWPVPVRAEFEKLFRAEMAAKRQQ